MTLQEQLSQKMAERQVLLDENQAAVKKMETDGVSEPEIASVESRSKKIEDATTEINRFNKMLEISARDTALLSQTQTPNPAGRPAQLLNSAPASGNSALSSASVWDGPATLRNGRVPKTFLRLAGGNLEAAREKAFAFGSWMLAAIYNHEKARAYCEKNGLYLRTAGSAENVNSSGGFLVPTPLDDVLIDLREEFGIARQVMRRRPMTSDTLSIARRAGTITPYWLTDGQAISASVKQWDMVSLTANKLAAFALYLSEVAEDAIIDVAEDLANEIAWNFAAMEDEAAFLGDGTSTYGGFVGFCTALVKIFTTGGGAGLGVGAAGTGGTWADFVLDDFNKVRGKLPRFAVKRGQCSWLCSQEFYETVMVYLMAAAGGNTIQTIQDGAMGQPKFLGSPVIISQVMPTVAANSSVVCLYGNYSLASTFGDRRQTTIAQSTEYAFSTDQIAIRGIERVAPLVHDVGGTNAASQAQNPTYDQTGTTAVAGPVVGLMTNTS